MRTPTWNLMWNQARNNQTMVGPTLAVPYTIYVLTRSPIAMTITDDSHSCTSVFHGTRT